ncbi:adenosylcobinamide-GDP ribazoletransferase [Marinomonas epiphytica]
MLNKVKFEPYWQGFKRSLVTYTRLPLKVDWSDDVAHMNPIAFLPWVGVVIGIISAWSLWFDLSTSLQALLMLLTAVLITGGFHEDGLMDSVDGLIGGWTPEQRLEIMKDSRIGSYGALSIWFVMTLKWLLLTELLGHIKESFLDLLLGLVAWCAVQVVARLTPLVLMSFLNYVTLGNSKALNMIAKLSKRDWLVALTPVLLMLLFAFNLTELWVVVLLLIGFWSLLKAYLNKKIQGFNGDTLGASEQLSEVLVLFILLASFS